MLADEPLEILGMPLCAISHFNGISRAEPIRYIDGGLFGIK